MRTAYVLSICLLGFSVAAAEKEATLKVGAKSYAVSELPPPPEGFVSPMTWGVDTHIIERFGQAGVPREKIAMVKDTYSFVSRDKSPAQFVEILEQCYGPTMNAFEAAQKSGTAEQFHNQLLELAKAQNKSTEGTTSIPATFLRVTVSL